MKNLLLRLKDIFDALPYPVFAKDDEHRWIYGNQAFADLIGREDFVGLDDRDLFPPEQVEVFWAEDDRVLKGQESLNEEQIGEDSFALTKKVPLTFPDGRHGLVGIITDVIKMPEPSTESETHKPSLLDYVNSRTTMLQKRLNEAMVEKERALSFSRTDPATGLLNRAGLEHALSQQIKYADESGESFSLVLIDVDHFKRINEQYGHATGDTVINVLAKRLSKLKGAVSIARMGGDEFALISTNTSDGLEESLEKLWQARAFLFRPIRVGDNDVTLSGSTGACTYPRDADTVHRLRKRADLALHAAKKNGRNGDRVFDAVLQSQSRRRTRIEEMLPAAIEQRKITAHYQPILCSETRHVRGVEVLARWNDEVLGPVGPDEFVAVAAELALQSRLDKLIMDIAMREARDWLASGAIAFLSINISPIDIVSRGFATDLLRRIKAADIRPDQLCLEILESAIIEDVDSARRNIARLREAGVTIALDDYGTGYSNLRALLDMPLDRLKIDKSLVAGIESNTHVLDLVISIVQLGRSLNLALVAEGVETASQAAFIEGAGCPLMQGYFFARPMPAEALSRWLDAHAKESDTNPRRQNRDIA
ncbi:EAL domain-containing protein [Henriciella aquimarina]|uniref:EAL domain-containing protein n=1 Tax=Henriciella aquimarina TaxID=545261 RepID=UPI000A05D6FF|nr:EAL domain-containing protein [Henriciella aquimarina]